MKVGSTTRSGSAPPTTPSTVLRSFIIVCCAKRAVPAAHTVTLGEGCAAAGFVTATAKAYLAGDASKVSFRHSVSVSEPVAGLHVPAAGAPSAEQKSLLPGANPAADLDTPVRIACPPLMEAPTRQHTVIADPSFPAMSMLLSSVMLSTLLPAAKGLLCPMLLVRNNGTTTRSKAPPSTTPKSIPSSICTWVSLIVIPPLPEALATISAAS